MRTPAGIIPFVLLVLISSVTSACRDAKRTDDPNPSSAVSSTASVAAPAPPTSAPVATDDLKDASASPDIDIDLDAGKRKLRRLGSVADASAPEPTAAVAAPTTPAPADSRAGKRGAKPMGDELPYGGTGASAAPVLEKKPLVKEDPWAKPAPP